MAASGHGEKNSRRAYVFRIASDSSPAVQLLIAAFIILISALAGLWLVDKLLIYLVARSYVDDVGKERARVLLG
jgi:hypothetical protein